MKRGFCVVATCMLVAPAFLRAQASNPVQYNRDIRPILSNHCFKCHGPDLKNAGLNLLTFEGATRELSSGHPAVVPGKSSASELIARISETEAGQRMPLKGVPLTQAQIELLRTWIDQGAKYETHWAYRKPVRPPLPGVKNSQWIRNEIDAYVLGRLEQEGLNPAPEADRAVLLRRVSLDLTGLPPSVAEVDAFVHDGRPDAYERAVDRLLASPHYGEHQARFWLDYARYADSNGYEKDGRRTIWPYRDWVIHAFNCDMPFDRFTIEQIAADLLPNATIEQRIATGFHRNTMVNTEGGTDDEEFRVAAVVDRVNTTMETWLGTTMGCAQCHNHKFDPFRTKEYYGLFAFFNTTTDRGGSNTPEIAVQSPLLNAEAERARGEKARYKKAENSLALAMGLPGLQVIEDRERNLQRYVASLKPSSTLVLQEMARPRVTRVMIRGNYKNLGEEVKPGVPAALHPMPAGAPLNRLGLARWLVDSNNPLVGRVIMNRVWARLFGKGFVDTSEDFGTQGDLPTHPELLDFLATEWVDRHWSQKEILKLIVTSATYRQSSRLTEELQRRDPLNRLFARGPRFRLDAEMVRDNALAISGLLNRKIGGPSVYPYQPDGIWFSPHSSDRWVMSTGSDLYRRGVYTFWRRTSPYAAFMTFDAPSREVACERRPRTNTPLQALATLNDKVFIEASSALARRMLTEIKGGERERLVYGFRLCVARMPTSRELELLTELLASNREMYRKDPSAARAMARVTGSDLPAGVAAADLAAWTVLANVLLNLDETITKG